MMSNNHHTGASKKRKTREDFDAQPSSSPIRAEPLLPSNRLLAGYLAHEFLTHGTLFGRKFDEARANAKPLGTHMSTQPTKPNTSSAVADPGAAAAAAAAAAAKQHAYADVSNMLKTDGVHIPNVVNPTQLARWLQM